MAKKKALPKETFLYWDYDSDPPFLTVTESPEDLENGQIVGFYKLRYTQKVKVSVVLE